MSAPLRNAPHGGFSTLTGCRRASQTNKLAWDNLPRHWNFMLFYTLWNLCEFIFVYFVYVETKGPTLEEIARIFDGENAVPRIDLDEDGKEARMHDLGYVSESKTV